MTTATTLSPQALAEACAHAMWADDLTSQRLGMSIERIAPGEATLSMEITDFMLNGHGLAHGGFVFALADSAFAYVCNGGNHASVAAQASIVFLDKVAEGETLFAEAEEVVREGRAGVTRVSVRTSDGRTIAEFTGYSRTLGGAVVDV